MPEEMKKEKGKGKRQEKESQGVMSKTTDIRMRTFDFAVRIVKLCRYLDEKPGASRTLSNQLLKAATSVGANIEEAQAGQSKLDFISKNAIALKEARETHYWFSSTCCLGTGARGAPWRAAYRSWRDHANHWGYYSLCKKVSLKKGKRKKEKGKRKRFHRQNNRLRLCL